ncbi:MAG: SRPBCC family protein [Ardenticatenaceae bacterium]|nr:SRPBCC family protein [Ardenticatenaceae bacterium]
MLNNATSMPSEAYEAPEKVIVSQFTEIITIARPIKEVFDFIVDLRNDLHWWGPVAEVELLTPEPIQVGTKWRQKTKVAGFPLGATIELVSKKPPTYARIQCEEKSFRFVADYRLSGDDKHAVVAMDVDLAIKGLLGFVTPYVVSYSRAEMTEYFGVLKEYLESQ